MKAPLVLRLSEIQKFPGTGRPARAADHALGLLGEGISAILTAMPGPMGAYWPLPVDKATFFIYIQPARRPHLFGDAFCLFPIFAGIHQDATGALRKKFADFWCRGARLASRESAGISGIFRAFATPRKAGLRHQALPRGKRSPSVGH